MGWGIMGWGVNVQEGKLVGGKRYGVNVQGGRCPRILGNTHALGSIATVVYSRRIFVE